MHYIVVTFELGLISSGCNPKYYSGVHLQSCDRPVKFFTLFFFKAVLHLISQTIFVSVQLAMLHGKGCSPREEKTQVYSPFWAFICIE